MTASSDGKLYIVGGHSPACSYTHTSSIEAFSPATNTCVQVGHLQQKQCHGVSCCSVDDHLLVCGCRDGEDNHTVQVYNVKTSTITHTLTLPYKGYSWVCGAVLTHGHLIVVAHHYTAVVTVDDVLHGRTGSLHMVNNYVTPNWSCGVAVNSDDSHILVLGGAPKDDKPDHYVYQASISDVLGDTKAGWQKVKCTWPHGSCEMFGGYCVGGIAIPA